MIKRSSDNASLRGCGYAGGYDAAEAKSVTYRVDSRPARLVVVSADQVVASARQLPAEESHFDLGERRTYTPRKGEPADYAQRTLLVGREPREMHLSVLGHAGLRPVWRTLTIGGLLRRERLHDVTTGRI